MATVIIITSPPPKKEKTDAHTEMLGSADVQLRHALNTFRILGYSIEIKDDEE